MTASDRPRRRRVSPLPYLLILPTFVFVALCTIWPMLLAGYQSLFLQRLNIARYREPTFVGLQNYKSYSPTIASTRC